MDEAGSSIVIFHLSWLYSCWNWQIAVNLSEVLASELDWGQRRCFKFPGSTLHRSEHPRPIRTSAQSDLENVPGLRSVKEVPFILHLSCKVTGRSF
jgi:hypothetical protein